MSADWDEVKRLAADFQRAQLSSTVQRYLDALFIFNINICIYKFYFNV